MFDELSKDFGSVPRGPAVVHPFRFTNNTGQAVHIAGVRVSCGCVTATASRADVAPGQSAVVQASMDTRRFYGTKSVTVYVQFDQPAWEEVRLWVQANSRDDVSVTPEELALGQAKRGTSPNGKITITFLGNSQSQLTEVERESSYVETSFKEVSRDAGQVSYEVAATVRPDTPVGKWYTDLWLKTNNPAMPKVRVPLTVEIQAPLTISTTNVTLGQIKPGAVAERKVILRGAKPFRITKVEGTDGNLDVNDSTKGSREVHVLTIRLRATKEGELSRHLKVLTDLPQDGEIEFDARARVQ
jgi:hypothetical protein